MQEAREAYQKAIDSGHEEAAPLAAYCLGGRLADQGEVREAREAYQKAIDSGHEEAAPLAAYRLGELLKGKSRGRHQDVQTSKSQAKSRPGE